MMEKRITKKERFMELKEIVANRPELVEFLDHEIELLNKKASIKTPSKNQKENEGLKELIVETLRALGKPVTITDIQNANENLKVLSNQKISALLTQLKDTNVIVRVVDKKKAFFALV